MGFPVGNAVGALEGDTELGFPIGFEDGFGGGGGGGGGGAPFPPPPPPPPPCGSLLFKFSL